MNSEESKRMSITDACNGHSTKPGPAQMFINVHEFKRFFLSNQNQKVKWNQDAIFNFDLYFFKSPSFADSYNLSLAYHVSFISSLFPVIYASIAKVFYTLKIAKLRANGDSGRQVAHQETHITIEKNWIVNITNVEIGRGIERKKHTHL